MSPATGPVVAAALLLGVAGVAKVLRPAATQVALRTAGLPSMQVAARALGAAEVALAAVAIAFGGRLAAVIVGVSYLGFAGFSAVVLRRGRGQASCGCFGGGDAPVTRLHIVINVIVAGLAAATLADPGPGIVGILRDTPLAGVPFLIGVLLLAWLLQVALTLLPALQSAVRPKPAVAPSLSITSKPKATP